MKGYFILLSLLGLAVAAPQNWPYRDSLMPYRYGYPSQSQYKYLPQIEDDEDIGPYPGVGLGRQDFVVGSDGQSLGYVYRGPLYANKAWLPKWKIGDRVRPTPEPTVVTGVIETGSVAPVVEPKPAQAPTIPAPPPPRPVGPEGGKPVQPPPFPPARPPPTPPPRAEEEDEDDDESDEEADEEDDNVEDEEKEGGDDDDGDNNDEEDEEERRRQEPLSEEKVEDGQPPVALIKTAPDAPPAAVVVKPVPVVNKTVPTPVPVSVEQVNSPASVESNEVAKPAATVETEEDSSEEHGLGDGVEALVPGYVTDQGEVLVPVDTVTGDQPISIVPDPYTPPTRGVALGGSPSYRFSKYNSNPFFYSDIYDDDFGRQESEEEYENSGFENEEQQPTKGSGSDDEERGNESEENETPEGRNEYLTAFPPSRTPELYAVINSRFPSESEEFESYGSQRPTQHNRPAPILYRVKQTQQRPSVSVAVALTGGNPQKQQQYIRHPNVNQAIRNPFLSQYVRNPYVAGQYFRNPYFQVRNPYETQFQHQRYNPYSVQHLRNPYIHHFVNRVPYSPYAGPYSQELRSPFYGGQIYRPHFFPPPHPFGGYSPRPRPPFNRYRPQSFTDTKPVFVKRKPGGFIPVGVTDNNKHVEYVASPQHPKPIRKSPGGKRPTPVVHQDDDVPYTFEDPHAYFPDTSNSNEFPGQSDFAEHFKTVPVHKSRRAAKMAKKVTKKNKGEDKKKVSEADPLNILKKVSSKKS